MQIAYLKGNIWLGMSHFTQPSYVFQNKYFGSMPSGHWKSPLIS